MLSGIAKMKKVAISQPTYLPWLGYIKMIQSVDVFVFLDNVQFEKQSWQSRNRIKTNKDQPIWLTVPTQNHPLGTSLREIKIANRSNWQRKHLNSIQTYLGKTPYCNEVQSLVQTVFDHQFDYLTDLNIEIIKALCQKLQVNTQLIRASELDVSGKKTDLLLDILTTLEADEYLANLGSKSYLKEDEYRFIQAGIHLGYHNWQPPIYQQNGQVFIDKLAWIDPVSYLGFDTDKLLE